MLIEKGANVNAVDDGNRTPLHRIAYAEYPQRDHAGWTEDDYLSKFNFFNLNI